MIMDLIKILALIIIITTTLNGQHIELTYCIDSQGEENCNFTVLIDDNYQVEISVMDNDIFYSETVYILNKKSSEITTITYGDRARVSGLFEVNNYNNHRKQWLSYLGKTVISEDIKITNDTASVEIKFKDYKPFNYDLVFYDSRHKMHIIHFPLFQELRQIDIIDLKINQNKKIYKLKSIDEYDKPIDISQFPYEHLMIKKSDQVLGFGSEPLEQIKESLRNNRLKKSNN